MTRTPNDEPRTRGYRACGVTVATILCLALSGCGGGAGSVPTAPSPARSFLEGTWKGTVSIAPKPLARDPLPTTTGTTTWVFEARPDTNLQVFSVTIRQDHDWLPVDMRGTVFLPTNTPPVDITTPGDYRSPRGCLGSFFGTGVAERTTIDLDFTGSEVDCDSWRFTGRVLLEKQ